MKVMMIMTFGTNCFTSFVSQFTHKSKQYKCSFSNGLFKEVNETEHEIRKDNSDLLE